METELRIRPGSVEWREIDGEIVLLDVASSAYLAVNASGSVLWPALIEGTTHEALVTTLQEIFGAEESDAIRDVDAFVADLGRRDLLAR
jgi:hypothetical protein